MAKDLEGIYWIWDFVTRHNVEANIVVAIQKDRQDIDLLRAILPSNLHGWLGLVQR